MAVGQSIGTRTTVDYDAIVWRHDHFRTMFLAAMRTSSAIAGFRIGRL